MRSCLNLDDEMLKFGTAGKPCAKIEKLPFFNLSHAGDYVVLATAQNEVGVDIEPVHAYEDAVAERCLTPEEHAWRKRRGGKWAFYKLWTAKESVMKATGKGFTLPPESFCILPVDDSAHVIERRSWYLDWLYVECHIVCVAVENEREHIAVSFLR
ncbi:MAG: 4'-phosphopantetheinyl transferase superfamily protein [Desulfovibrio sp.]|nr:4'-phosphopantetheinyl transferase superfamily protein [Desulfovibrio sp.]